MPKRQRRSERSGARGRRRAKGKCLGWEMIGEKNRGAQRWMIVVYYCKFCEGDEDFFKGFACRDLLFESWMVLF